MSDQGKIIVTYTSVDYVRTRRTYLSLKPAQAFAQKYLGPTPTFGTFYAISDDGVGKIEVSGANLADLFPSSADVNHQTEHAPRREMTYEEYQGDFAEDDHYTGFVNRPRDTPAPFVPAVDDDCPF